MISKQTFFSTFPFMGIKLVTAVVATTMLFSAVAQAQDDVDFVKDIKPVFEQHCVVCHGPVEKEDEENDFRIDIRDDALDFIGESGAEDSDLFLLLISEEEEELMPPPGHSKLTEAEIASIKSWIDGGAAWPEDVKLVDTSKKSDSAGTETDTPVDGNASTDEQGPPKNETDKKTQQMFNALGSLHTAAIHLPIGLLLASGLFAFFSLRGNFVMSDCAYYCLWLGTLGAIFACVSGWFYSGMEHRGVVNEFADLLDQNQDIFWHRTGGIIVTVVAFLLALFAAGARNRDPDDGVLWKLGLILLAGGIGWVGHTGGELAYPGQYKDLNAVYERMIGGGGEENPAASDSATDPVSAPDENADIGETSDE